MASEAPRLSPAQVKDLQRHLERIGALVVVRDPPAVSPFFEGLG